MGNSSWWHGPILVYFSMLAVLLTLDSIPMPSLEVSVVAGWLIYIIPLAVMLYFIRRGERRGFWRSTGVKRQNLVMGFIWLLGLSVVFSLIIQGYQTVVAHSASENLENAARRVEEHFARFPDWYFWYFLPGSFIPIALAEELIFRGFVLNRFLAKGPVFAITASSLMFTLLHFWYVAIGAWIFLGSVFIISVWFGLAYYKTGNLIAQIVMHGLINAQVSIRHFWGEFPLLVMNAILAMASLACLLYLILTYIRGLGKKIEAPPTPLDIEKSIERMRSMLEELKKRRARRELSEGEYVRLSERYEARIRELEGELARRKTLSRS